jgi:peptide/nickel transport system substrate-binding protein/oligopeptide transport system substrate-binding protein
LAIISGCKRNKPKQEIPPENGVYRMSLTDNPKSFDPARITTVNEAGVARRIFNGLAKLSPRLLPVPDLAASWEISADGLTYTFHLRRGVKFHNGREVTAEDFRYSFERLLRQETASHRTWVVEAIAGAAELRAGETESLAGLKTLNKSTVVISLEEPFSLFLYYLAMVNAAVVPREEVDKPGDMPPFGRRPVGTGPFRLVRWDDNNVIELARNEDYFDGPAKLKGIRLRIIKGPLVAYQEYLAGNLEHCAAPERYLSEVRNGPHKAELRITTTFNTYFLGITMTREPYGENVHLRRALNYAVDRRHLCENVLGGSHIPASGLLPPGLLASNPDLKGYTYDPERAREELAKAGYGPDSPLPPQAIYVRGSHPSPLVVQAISTDFERVGIPVTVKEMDFGALRAATNRAEPPLFYLSWYADFPDADNFLMIFHSKQRGVGGNRVHYMNGEVDELLDRMRGETDRQRRIKLYREIEERIVADAPWVFLSHKQTQLLVKPYVRNFTLTRMDGGTSVNQVDFHKVEFAPAE